MASPAKDDMGHSSSGGGSQRPQAAAPEAAEDSQCPICLGPMRSPAYVTYCMHKFCLTCIQQWARARNSCPVCRQPMEQLLRSVRGDSDRRQRTVGRATRLRGRRDSESGLESLMEVMLWAVQAVQEQQQLWAARSRPVDTESAQRQEAAPGPSNAHSSSFTRGDSTERR